MHPRLDEMLLDGAINNMICSKTPKEMIKYFREAQEILERLYIGSMEELLKKEEEDVRFKQDDTNR